MCRHFTSWNKQSALINNSRWHFLLAKQNIALLCNEPRFTVPGFISHERTHQLFLALTTVEISEGFSKQFLSFVIFVEYHFWWCYSQIIFWTQKVEHRQESGSYALERDGEREAAWWSFGVAGVVKWGRKWSLRIGWTRTNSLGLKKREK